jgi:predicted amidohydrolase
MVLPGVGGKIWKKGNTKRRIMKLRLAGAQIAVSNDIDQNVNTLGRIVQKAGESRADILSTPEGSLSGYRPDFDPDLTQAGLQH